MVNPSDKPYTKNRLILSYLKDWLLVAIFIAAFFAIDSLDPYNRRFSLNDPTIQFTYATHERVPTWLLVIISFVAPLVIMSFIALVIKRSLVDCHHAALGLFLGLALTLMVTDTIKITVGRPRPDFLDRCKPQNGTHDASVFGLSTSDICTWPDPSIRKDGYKSFPSGHSSLSFAGMSYLSFYLAGKLHVFDQRGHTYKSFVTTAPYVVAALVAISRTQDYRHHWHDVVAGGTLGFVFAAFTYLQYYPLPWVRHSHKPYDHRFAKSGEELVPLSATQEMVGVVVDNPSTSEIKSV